MRRIIRLPVLVVAQSPPAAPSNPYEIPLNTDVLPFMLLLLAAAVCVGVMVMIRGAQRRCPHCRVIVRRLDGEAASGYLDAGQRREQQMGSVRYIAWSCPACGQHEIQAREPRPGRRRDACPECSYQTLRVDRETLESPTSASEGRRRVEKDCAHCGWHDETMIALPRNNPGGEVALLKVLRVAAQAASVLNTIDSARDRARGSDRGSSGDGEGGGDGSGRGSSGRW
jgi:ssDNA-binding Zn-finger/Zn-ribbon topoisomerase 1